MSKADSATSWLTDPTTAAEKNTRQLWEHTISYDRSDTVKYINASSEDIHHVVVLTLSSFAWLDEEIQKLEELKVLKCNWDTYGASAPNETAIKSATRALQQLYQLDVRPDRVAPSTEGGIVISFFEDPKYADIEFFNSGEIAAIISDADDRKVWKSQNMKLKRVCAE